MWELYDALIEGIDDSCTVEDLVCGPGTAFVRSNLGCGFSGAPAGRTRPTVLRQKNPGMKLRDLAACVKSWNLQEAGIGQAAINAYYNALPVAKANGVPVSDARFTEDRIYDPFISYQAAIRDKKVAVVGHFHYLDQAVPAGVRPVGSRIRAEGGRFSVYRRRIYFAGGRICCHHQRRADQ